jgi:hypothetical protein
VSLIFPAGLAFLIPFELEQPTKEKESMNTKHMNKVAVFHILCGKPVKKSLFEQCKYLILRPLSSLCHMNWQCENSNDFATYSDICICLSIIANHGA